MPALGFNTGVTNSSLYGSPDIAITGFDELGVTPLHAALYGRKVEVAKLLLAGGADVRLRLDSRLNRGRQLWL